MKVKFLSRVWPLATPWTAAHQAPPSMWFSWQEFWSGVPLTSPESYDQLIFFVLFIFFKFYFIFKLYNIVLVLPNIEMNPHIQKQRHYFANKGPSSEGYGFSCGNVWMLGLDCEESWAPKNWCFWTVVLEKTLESPLDCKEIQPVHPKGIRPGCSFEGLMVKLKLQ